MKPVMLDPRRSSDGHLNQRELKYVLDPDAAAAVWARACVRLQPHFQDRARPIAYLRTTYFDTPELTYYRTNDGAVSRRLRVREYANTTDPEGVPILFDVCYLELKQSAGGMRAKLRIPIRPRDAEAHLARLADVMVRPQLTTWYRRSALADRGERLRITLDECLTFCEPVVLGSACSGLEPERVFARGPAFVLEVKAWDEPPAWLRDCLDDVGEATSFSKFMTGMQILQCRDRDGDAVTATQW
jgi:VTC domain-containing protein